MTNMMDKNLRMENIVGRSAYWKRRIVKNGTSAQVNLPTELVEELDLKVGTMVRVYFIEGRVIIEPEEEEEDAGR